MVIATQNEMSGKTREETPRITLRDIVLRYDSSGASDNPDEDKTNEDKTNLAQRLVNEIREYIPSGRYVSPNDDTSGGSVSLGVSLSNDTMVARPVLPPVNQVIYGLRVAAELSGFDPTFISTTLKEIATWYNQQAGKGNTINHIPLAGTNGTVECYNILWDRFEPVSNGGN